MTSKGKKLIFRPPVVVVLGHIDHGKTSLLDYIRKSHVAEKESGGITQHIGAYEIEHSSKRITFIDTPGHEAFSAMRSRGAKVADIAILVVAADEGVKPQTTEAISHIKKADLHLIVAINKIDKPGADPEKVKRELVKEDIVVESMGGKIPSIEVSAKTGKGVNELLDLILLVAEMENLNADLTRKLKAVVVESYLDNQRGPTATLIIQEGVLKKGDILGTFSAFGKIKILENFQGQPLDEALPAMPVVVIGLEEVPGVGEEAAVFETTDLAIANLKKSERKMAAIVEEETDKKTLNIILKADVLGSLEAVLGILKDIPQDKVGLRILDSGVGGITDSDVRSAISSKARILGFRVKVNKVASALAEREKIKVLRFEIIYELVEAIRQLMEKMVKSEIQRTDLGKMKVLELFLNDRGRQIIGGKVIDGKMKKGASLEVFRREEKAGEGKIINLQRNKKEIDEVAKGNECGILYEGNVKVEVGDILFAYIQERIKGEL